VVQYDDGVIAGWNLTNIYTGYKFFVFAPNEKSAEPQNRVGTELTLAVLEGFSLEEVWAAFEAVCEQLGYAQKWDEACAEVLLEEFQPFFAGEKDAEQTAEVIQNRVQVYLNE